MPRKIRLAPVSALHEILKWSINRPEWQRDALRRIVVKGDVDEADLKELERLCRAKHETVTTTESAPKAEPLNESHIPPGPGSESSVTLVSIGNLQRVNRLPSDQVLPFGPALGLTVIYGDTGAGKSGYARVIKKACRTRGALPVIRPNAFAVSTTGPATAQLRIGGVDKPIFWTDGIASDGRLANVFVFDASTAGHYLEEDGPATFTPRGLDILPKLSKVCDAIRDRVQRDINRVNADIEATAKNWKYTPATKVGTVIGALTAATKPADIEALAGLDEKQAQRLKELEDALKSDPKQKAKATRASAQRLRAFSANVGTAARNLSDEQIAALRKLIEDAKTTAEAAKSFASGQFDSTFLPGTGGDLWRKLWEAARDYSMSAAYVAQEFPVTEGDAKCVLCQRDIDAQAAARLKAFDTFCKDKSQQLADQAAQQLREATNKVNKLQALAPESTKVEADLVMATEEQRVAIGDFVKAADMRLTAVKESLDKKLWAESSALPASPADAIIAMATALEQRATMEETADDPAVRTKLTSERDELAVREWLAGVKGEVLAQIERYKQVVIYEACQKNTATAQITIKNTELTKLLVTDAFCKRFEAEVNALGLRTLNVRQEEIKGMKGETKFGLRLAASGDSKIKEIASEGEQRCIALAAFLAELSQASHQSALVFDDPVSSLDHWHCEKIANRLVEESKVRQVIVFTHDAVFLNDLEAQAGKESVTPTFRFLEWNGDIPGQCQDGLPWDCKSPEDRLDKLEKRQRDIVKAWASQPSQTNVAEMRDAYSWLRATIERIVERVVFADVVFRFRSHVKLKDLRRVVGFTDSECDELLRLYKKCCDVTDAHDAPSGKHASVVEPAELAKDITHTKTLLTSIRSRHKGTTSGTSSVVITASGSGASV